MTAIEILKTQLIGKKLKYFYYESNNMITYSLYDKRLKINPCIKTTYIIDIMPCTLQSISYCNVININIANLEEQHDFIIVTEQFCISTHINTRLNLR